MGKSALAHAACWDPFTYVPRYKHLTRSRPARWIMPCSLSDVRKTRNRSSKAMAGCTGCTRVQSYPFRLHAWQVTTGVLHMQLRIAFAHCVCSHYRYLSWQAHARFTDVIPAVAKAQPKAQHAKLSSSFQASAEFARSVQVASVRAMSKLSRVVRPEELLRSLVPEHVSCSSSQRTEAGCFGIVGQPYSGWFCCWMVWAKLCGCMPMRCVVLL